ncbi:DUF1761 domain-containing protein [Candidatus Wolfebacteria bacterium]|nr:DUF1761 domain-containing protein [Candidatus Wolfebacteria bacterium]
MFGDINYLAVLVAGIVAMGIGSLWYGPLFGKPWMALMGITPLQMDAGKKKGMMKSYIIGFIGALVTAFTLAYLISSLGVAGVTGGLTLGFLVWLGFFVTTKLGSVLWEMRPWKLYFLNIGYDLVNLLVMGIILAVWQ